MLLLDLEAASAGSGVPVKRLRRWIKEDVIVAVPENRLPGWRPHRGRPKWMVDLEEVERVRDYLAQQRVMGKISRIFDNRPI